MTTLSSTAFTQELHAVVTPTNKDAIQALAKRHDCPLYVVINVAFEHDLDLLSDDPKIDELVAEGAQAEREWAESQAATRRAV
ncbi:MAG: hypothetical protein ACI38U_02190 [Corynebacterium sp.]|uniref:hypothetical protein n=1 Tax=Corynebacterium sp. TaxID=1720 RepID=UPI003F129AD7